jgi:FkbM family methyltransferase
MSVVKRMRRIIKKRTRRNIFKSMKRFSNWPTVALSLITGEEPTYVILKNGVKLEAPRDSVVLDIVDEIFYKNDYQPKSFCIDILQDDIVVDIGANIGAFSVQAAGKTHNRVLSFEPAPTNVEYLKKNVKNNGLANVQVFGMAVSDEEGELELHLSKVSSGHTLAKVAGDDFLTIKVPTTTLKNIMDDNGLERIDYLKVDTEGAEGKIFLSTPREYLDRINKIGMEFHDHYSEVKHEQLESFLTGCGFKTMLNWDGCGKVGTIYARRA